MRSEIDKREKELKALRDKEARRKKQLTILEDKNKDLRLFEEAWNAKHSLCQFF